MGLLGDLIIPLPTLLEQNVIIDYLDRETTQIDCLIEKSKPPLSVCVNTAAR